MTQGRRVLRSLPAKTVRSFGVTERDLKEMAQRPENLCIEEEQGLLVAEPLGESLTLHYGFTGLEAVRGRFAALLERLVEAAKERGRFASISLLFADRPQRPYLEPLFRHSGFEPQEEWFALTRTVAEADADTPVDSGGVVLRPAASADLDVLATLESMAPGGQGVSCTALAALMEAAVYLPVAVAGGALMGFLALRQRGDRGLLGPLVVHPSGRERGVGHQLVRGALAWLAQNEVWKAEATAGLEDTYLQGLYQELGFIQQQMGITYRRPLDFTLKPTLDIPKTEPKRLGVWGVKPRWA